MKQQNRQLDLFTDRGSPPSPVNEKLGAGGSHHPASSGKTTLDLDDLKRQLLELAPDVKVILKTNRQLSTAVKLDERDKGYTVTLNPKRWRRKTKASFLENWIIKTVCNGSA